MCDEEGGRGFRGERGAVQGASAVAQGRRCDTRRRRTAMQPMSLFHHPQSCSLVHNTPPARTPSTIPHTHTPRAQEGDRTFGTAGGQHGASIPTQLMDCLRRAMAAGWADQVGGLGGGGLKLEWASDVG